MQSQPDACRREGEIGLARRHDSLIPFSRDHHQSLVRAVRMINAHSAAADRIAALQGFVYEWDRRMRQHFIDEERLLIPLMLAEERSRLVGDHDALRSMVEQARTIVEAGAEDGGLCGEAGTRLEAHVRWEERVLFPTIEQRATPEELASLAYETARIDADPPRA